MPRCESRRGAIFLVTDSWSLVTERGQCRLQGKDRVKGLPLVELGEAKEQPLLGLVDVEVDRDRLQVEAMTESSRHHLLVVERGDELAEDLHAGIVFGDRYPSAEVLAAELDEPF